MSQWRQRYPLPVGKAAVIESAPYLPEVYEAIPFEGNETALWALRVERGTDTLDLFGLAGERVNETQVSVGELSYSLRGQNTTFFEVVHLARTWWAKFRGLPVGGGRPLNSGTWASGEDFEQAVRVAVEGLRGQGKEAKQVAVAHVLVCDDSQLRRWIRRYDLNWAELIRA